MNMKNKDTALAIRRTSSIADNITPPAKKSEIIEAMVRRRIQQIDEQIEAARVASENAQMAFDEASRKAFDAYVAKKSARALAQNYSASYYTKFQDGSYKPSVSVNAHINLPEVECEKLAKLAAVLNTADKELRSLKSHRPTESSVRGEIRRAMSAASGGGNISARVSAILSDTESVKVIDAALAEMRTKCYAKDTVVQL